MNVPNANEKPVTVLRSIGLFCRCAIVGVILREKNNVWWWWDYAKEAAHGLAGVLLATVWLICSPVTVPIMLVIQWKNVNQEYVNKKWKSWTSRKRQNIVLGNTPANPK